MYIKKFMDKVSALETRKAKDLVMPMSDARLVRDEVSKLLADLHELTNEKTSKEEVIDVKVTGGTFK